MIEGTASRHMYSMASWSPSQSAPLTVSYMCHSQWSSAILPSAAEIPPWAATVWDRVGKTLVIQAVFKPAAAIPSAAARRAKLFGASAANPSLSAEEKEERDRLKKILQEKIMAKKEERQRKNTEKKAQKAIAAEKKKALRWAATRGWRPDVSG